MAVYVIFHNKSIVCACICQSNSIKSDDGADKTTRYNNISILIDGSTPTYFTTASSHTFSPQHITAAVIFHNKNISIAYLCQSDTAESDGGTIVSTHHNYISGSICGYAPACFIIDSTRSFSPEHIAVAVIFH